MLAKLLVLTVVALVAPQVVPGVKVKGIETAAGIAVVFALLNLVIGWLLYGALTFISFPFVILTFGLFLFLITLAVNAVLLRLTDAILDSFELSGWGPAFGMGFLFALGAKASEWLL